MKTDMRRSLARQPFEEKIRKVGELIRLRLSLNLKPTLPMIPGRQPCWHHSKKAATELDAGNGIPIERVRKHIREWTK